MNTLVAPCDFNGVVEMEVFVRAKDGCDVVTNPGDYICVLRTIDEDCLQAVRDFRLSRICREADGFVADYAQSGRASRPIFGSLNLCSDAPETNGETTIAQMSDSLPDLQSLFDCNPDRNGRIICCAACCKQIDGDSPDYCHWLSLIHI